MTVFTVTDEEYALISADLMRVQMYLTARGAADDTRDRKVIREALTLAAIVSYCRPFTPGRDAKRKFRHRIPAQLVEDLPSEHQRTHNRLLKARNQAWAHTDWAAHTPHGYSDDTGAFAVLSRNPWVSLDPSEIAEFEGLLREVNARLQPTSAAQSPDRRERKDP